MDFIRVKGKLHNPFDSILIWLPFKHSKELVQDKNKEVHAAKDGCSGSLLNRAQEVVEIQIDLDNASNGGGSSNVFLWCDLIPWEAL